MNFHPVVDGQVFLCGGATDRDPCSRHLWSFQPSHQQVCSSILSVLDLRDEKHIQVSQLPSMRQGRNFPAVVALNGKIFAMGGRAPDSKDERLRSVEVYDVKTNQWSEGAPLVINPIVRITFPTLFLFRGSSDRTLQE